jgi:tetratricopeptide (TPR) repeat protein
MSLIADALKKAQSAKLGRRYLKGDASSVLPKAREGRQVNFSAALGRLNLSPTLMAGLGSGVLFFVLLVIYFFFGRGPKSNSPVAISSEAVERTQAELILAPPPLVAAVEPLALENSAAAEKVGEETPSLERIPQPRQKVESETSEIEKLPAKPAAAEKPRKKRKKLKVAVAPELPEEVRHHFNLALFYQEERKFPSARRAYEKVLELWPLYVEAHNNLGVVYKELGMYEKGIAELQKALVLNRRYPSAYHNLGVLYQMQGDWEQAIKNYETALSLDGRRMSSYNNLGLVYKSQERPHEAREVLEKALTIDPDFPPIHYNLALVLEEVGEPGLARLHYQKFIDLAGERDGSLVEKVRLHLQGLRAKG